MKLFAIRSWAYLSNRPARDPETGRHSPTLPDELAAANSRDARKFSTAGDASAWMDTHRINPDAYDIVPVPPAAMAEAEAAARAEWIGRGGRVQVGGGA